MTTSSGGMRTVDPRTSTQIGGDFAPTEFPIVDLTIDPPPSAPAEAPTVAVARVVPAPPTSSPSTGTVWVSISDDGAQVLCHDFLPHRAVEQLMRARRQVEADQSVLFDAVESILNRVLVDRAAFDAWVDDPANRVDSTRYFDVFNRILRHYMPGDEGKA